MALSALLNSERVVGAFLSDVDWKALVVESKNRNLFMHETGLPALAKTRRYRGGVTRYFSHFPGEAPEGYASHVSLEHESFKFAVYKALLDAGFSVELESGSDDWRADVLLHSNNERPSIAFEIQHSTQSAQSTIDRTKQRVNSGVMTVWLFKGRASTGHLNAKFLQGTPVFNANCESEAAKAALAVAGGEAYFENLESFKQTPLKPIAVQIPCRCGTRWLRPIGVVLLFNMIRQDLTPTFKSVCVSSVKTVTRSNANAKLSLYDDVFEKCALKYDIPLGRVDVKIRSHSERIDADGIFDSYFGKGNRGYLRRYICPKCGNSDIGHLPVPRGVDMEYAPILDLFRVDGRFEVKCEESWHLKRVSAGQHKTASITFWKDRFLNPMRLQVMKKLHGE